MELKSTKWVTVLDKYVYEKHRNYQLYCDENFYIPSILHTKSVSPKFEVTFAPGDPIPIVG